MQYKFYINGEYETCAVRTVVNSPNGANRKLYVTTADTIFIDWSGAPNPPSSLTASGISDTCIQLNFGAASNASDGKDSFYYKIYRRNETDSQYIYKYTTPVISAYFIDSGLSSGVMYYYRVTCVDSGNTDTNMLEGNLSSSANAAPFSNVNIVFSVSAEGIRNIDTVYIGSAELGAGFWTEYALTKIGNTYFRSFSLQPGVSVTYKYLYSTGGSKTYEFPYSGSRKYLFIYPYNGTDTSVKVRGGWDAWSSDISLILGADSYWRATSNLSAGKYEYKYWINGLSWVFDPYNSVQKNGNSYMGVEAIPTNSSLREIIVPVANDTFASNWEDTPFAITGLTTTSMNSSTIRINWDAVNLIEDAETITLKYTTTPNIDSSFITLANLSKDSTSYLHSGITNCSQYYYSAYVTDGSGVTSSFSELTFGTPILPVNITLSVDVSGIRNIDTVYVGSSELGGGGWNEYVLTKVGATDTYARTFSIQPATAVSYKFLYSSGGSKTYEFPYSISRKNLFIYPYNGTDTSVKVKGDWDFWSGDLNMILGADSYWRVTSIISPGPHEYKFVTNGINWMFDPYNSLQKNGNSYMSIEALTTNSFIREFTSPSNDTSYYSNWDDTPFAITGLTAAGITPTSILLSWDAFNLIEDAETVTLKYTITPNIDSSFITLAQLSKDSTSYTHYGTSSGTMYYYRAYISDGSGKTSRFSELANCSSPFPSPCSVKITYPSLNTHDTITGNITVSGTSLNSANGDSLIIYVNGIVNCQLPVDNFLWSGTASVSNKSDSVCVKLICGGSISYDTITVNYFALPLIKITLPQNNLDTTALYINISGTAANLSGNDTLQIYINNILYSTDVCSSVWTSSVSLSYFAETVTVYLLDEFGRVSVDTIFLTPGIVYSGFITLEGKENDSSGAQVSISNDTETFTNATDTSGKYYLRAFYPDTFIFSAVKSFYKIYTTSLFISSSQNIDTPVILDAGDIYRDGKINMRDAALLKKYYGKVLPEFDINGDSILGPEEKAFILKNFEK